MNKTMDEDERMALELFPDIPASEDEGKGKMTEKRQIELTQDIAQQEPVGWLVFGHNTDCDYYVFGCQAEASDFAVTQRDSAEAETWPMYPLFASSPEMI